MVATGTDVSRYNQPQHLLDSIADHLAGLLALLCRTPTWRVLRQPRFYERLDMLGQLCKLGRTACLREFAERNEERNAA